MHAQAKIYAINACSASRSSVQALHVVYLLQLVLDVVKLMVAELERQSLGRKPHSETV